MHGGLRDLPGVRKIVVLFLAVSRGRLRGDGQIKSRGRDVKDRDAVVQRDGN